MLHKHSCQVSRFRSTCSLGQGEDPQACRVGSAVGCVLVFDAHGLVEFASWLLHWAVLFIFLGRGAFLSSMQMLQGTVGVVLLQGLGSIIASRSWGGRPLPRLW